MKYDMHLDLRVAVEDKHSPEIIDAWLAKCPDPECLECGEIICPMGEPLHFHHDGCPACDGGVRSSKFAQDLVRLLK